MGRSGVIFGIGGSPFVKGKGFSGKEGQCRRKQGKKCCVTKKKKNLRSDSVELPSSSLGGIKAPFLKKKTRIGERKLIQFSKI